MIMEPHPLNSQSYDPPELMVDLSNDISEIFEKYKEIQKFYNLDLFKDKSYDLLIEFLYEYFDIMEEIDDALEEEDFLEYNIYER